MFSFIYDLNSIYKLFQPLVNTVHYNNTENGQKWTDLSKLCEGGL